MDFLTENTQNTENTENMDCPICMDIIDLNNNYTKTECGHMFHSSCLMKNIAHNGLNCPCCRNVMAEEPEEEYIDEGEYDDEGEDDDEDENDDEGENDHEEIVAVPTTNYVAKKLLEQGITFEQLVHMYCNLDHEEFDDEENANIFEDELFGKIRIIVSNYQENPENPENPEIVEETYVVDQVSEPKTICMEDSVRKINKECID